MIKTEYVRIHSATLHLPDRFRIGPVACCVSCLFSLCYITSRTLASACRDWPASKSSFIINFSSYIIIHTYNIYIYIHRCSLPLFGGASLTSSIITSKENGSPPSTSNHLHDNPAAPVFPAHLQYPAGLVSPWPLRPLRARHEPTPCQPVSLSRARSSSEIQLATSFSLPPPFPSFTTHKFRSLLLFNSSCTDIHTSHDFTLDQAERPVGGGSHPQRRPAHRDRDEGSPPGQTL